MKKILSIFCSTLMLLFVLTGCVQNDIGVKIKDNGTGSISYRVGIRKDLYDQMKESGSDPFDGMKTSTYKDDDATYISYSEKKEYSSYEKMEKALLDLEFDSEKLSNFQQDTNVEPQSEMENSEDTFEEDLIVEEENPKDEHLFNNVEISKKSYFLFSKYKFNAVSNMQNDESEIKISDFLKITVTVEMPGQIKNHFNGTVEKNKIIFNMTENEKMAAESTSVNYVMIGIAAILTIGISVIVIECVVRKKKSESKNED